MARDGAEVVRRLAARAADERTPMTERIASALEACRRIERDKLMGLEEHEKPAYQARRVEGPWYLVKEDEKRYYFIFWKGYYASTGIPNDDVRELVLLKEAVLSVDWMTDNTKKQRCGCCPSQPVAGCLYVAVAP